MYTYTSTKLNRGYRLEQVNDANAFALAFQIYTFGNSTAVL